MTKRRTVRNALGRRLKTIEKNAQGTTTSDRHAVYDGLDLIADLNENDSLVASYTHGPGIDDPLIVRKSGNDYFYYKNHLGSVTELRDANGAGYKTYVYDAFGNMEETGPTFNRGFTYTGRELHNRSGLYYYRARFYDPRLGRFISQDPIGILGGVNLYAYVGNDPVNWVDPLGLKIVVKGDEKAYWNAVAYLWRDPGMRKIITDLTLSETTYTITTNSVNLDYYNHSVHWIQWDPYWAGRTANGGSQSPALILGHELAHAQGWSGELRAKTCPQYGNEEEKRVITGPETDAARTLGESIRNEWVWTPGFPVSNPRSRFPLQGRGEQ